MTIVDRLKHFSEVGTVIACPQMTLLAGDHEPPVIAGEGEIKVLSTTTFGYTLRGLPDDIGHALRSLRRIDADPYNGLLRERLTATTSDGVELAGGWTIPKVHVPEEDGPWVFSGEIDALSFHENGTFDPGTEVAFLLPLQHRARLILRRFFAKPVGDELPAIRLAICGSEIVITLHDEANLLRVLAPATAVLQPTFTENWLGEPLRILFGQLVFPRFVARQSETWSMSWVRPSPPWSKDSNACALWQGDNELTDKEGFWETYRQLLTYIVTARDTNGSRNFEANKLTELYCEVVQAAHGSRWIWALTYASAVEAILEIFGLADHPRTDIDARALTQLKKSVNEFKKLIDSWTGDPALKEPAKYAVSRMLKTSAVQGLRRLKAEGWVTENQFKAWDKLRNEVMHGTLVSPYSSVDDDKMLLDLAHLFHALTRRLIADVNFDYGETI
jgi:hypothetical protein